MVEAQYPVFFEHLPLPAVVVDQLGFIQQANLRASDMLGLSREVALQHKSMMYCLNPEARRQLQWCLGNGSRAATHEMLDIELLLEDGHKLPCNIHITGLNNDPETAPYREQLHLMLFVDQTPVQEQRISEERYRLQTERLAEVIWASHGGIWEWNAASEVMHINDRWAEILGYTLDELSPMTVRSCFALIHPDDLMAAKTTSTACFEALAENFDVKVRLAHRLGGWVWVQNRGRVVERDEDNLPSRMIGMMVDISSEMAQANALEAAKLAAEEAQRINTEFMANLSHEIRTPLNSVLGLIQLVRQSKLAPAQAKLIEDIVQSGQMLSRTLNELLDHAKLEASGVELENKPLQLRELLGSTMVLFNQQAKKAGIGLFAKVSPDVPETLLGDALRLQQVISNLVSNAIKFTPQGQVDIQISPLQQSGTEDLMLMVEVQDTGIGIKPEEHARLFTPFFQSDASITRRYGGTGLGLSICKRLVALMGGTMGVDSLPGKGSRFWFTAKFERAAAQASTPWSPSAWQMGQAKTTLPLKLDMRNKRQQIQALEQALIKHDIKAIELAAALVEGEDASNDEFFLRLKNKLEVYDFHGALDDLKAVKP